MADKPTETAAPATDPETGLAMHGKYPLNSLLRAEALAKAGKDADPDGLVDAEAIKDAGVRAARLAKADDHSAPKSPAKEA